MTQQFENIKEYLQENSFRITCSLEEFLENKIIVFACPSNHISKIKNTSFINKKSKYKYTPRFLCDDCTQDQEEKNRFEDFRNKILEKNGHILLKIEKGRKIIYKCKNCNSENQTFLTNILKNLGNCPNCQNEKFKNSTEKIKQVAEEKKQEFIYYKNCKEVELKCPKNHIYKTTFHFMKIGRECPICRPERAKETSMQKYGVSNPMKCPEIFKRHQEQSFKSKEFIFPSGKKVYVQGYERECIKKLLEKYDEKEIITDPTEIPTIEYKKLINSDIEKKAIYYPDIKLPDKLIEVKSIYTYELNKINNLRKFETCAFKGYTLEVWIYNDKKQLVETHIYKKDRPVIIFIE